MTTKNFIMYSIGTLFYGILIGTTTIVSITTSKVYIIPIIILIILTALFTVTTMTTIINLNSNKKNQESNKLKESH